MVSMNRMALYLHFQSVCLSFSQPSTLDGTSGKRLNGSGGAGVFEVVTVSGESIQSFNVNCSIT